MIAQALETPNEVASRLIGRDYLSYSAFSTFQRCPLKFHFKYVAGLPEETVSASLVFGGAVHTAIEYHFNELMCGSSVPDQDTLLSAFWNSWDARRREAEIQFGKGEDVNSIGHLADRVLAAFRDSDLAESEGRVLGVEEELRGSFTDGSPDLLARIDLLAETDDALVITDFKTSRSRWNQQQANDSAEQLLVYSELIRQLVPRKNVILRFGVLTKTKQPSAEQFDVRFDGRQVERSKRVFESVWRAIQSGNVYPNPSPLNCSGCAFRKQCGAWSG